MAEQWEYKVDQFFLRYPEDEDTDQQHLTPTNFSKFLSGCLSREWGEEGWEIIQIIPLHALDPGKLGTSWKTLWWGRRRLEFQIETTKPNVMIIGKRPKNRSGAGPAH